MMSYAPPVRRLFEIGRPDPRRSDKWLDYVSDVGLSAENVDELARIVGDLSFDQHEDDDRAFWARVHAWRALGQLRAETSVEALITCVKTSDRDDEWASSELPWVFGMIGGATIPALLSLLDDPLLTDASLMTVVDCLKEIGTQNPDHRAGCVGILSDALKSRSSSPPFVNGCIIGCLLDLKAVDAIDVIRDAFQRNVVDFSIAGDLEDVEVELGLKASRSTPTPFYPLFSGHTPDMFARPQAKPRVNAVKTGRNDPCPCGSGKKYKKCCLQ